MEIEDELQPKINNNINENSTEKKRYFRVEKKKYNPFEQKEKNSNKKIFITQKGNNSPNVKRDKEFKTIKLNSNNKFITTMNINPSDKDNGSFVLKKIIPKRLEVIKEPKIESKRINNFWKSKNFLLSNNSNIFSEEQKINYCFNNISNNEQNNINNYRIKLMLVYFYSIKNLCKYINAKFNSNSLTEQKEIDDLTSQIYQSLQILDRKINEFMNFENLKDNVKVNKEDFNDITSLKENLLLMKNILNNSMSQNLINIYLNIEQFCRLYENNSYIG